MLVTLRTADIPDGWRHRLDLILIRVLFEPPTQVGGLITNSPLSPLAETNPTAGAIGSNYSLLNNGNEKRKRGHEGPSFTNWTNCAIHLANLISIEAPAATVTLLLASGDRYFGLIPFKKALALAFSAVGAMLKT